MLPLLEGVASCPILVIRESVLSCPSMVGVLLEILTIDMENKYRRFVLSEFEDSRIQILSLS